MPVPVLQNSLVPACTIMWFVAHVFTPEQKAMSSENFLQMDFGCPLRRLLFPEGGEGVEDASAGTA